MILALPIDPDGDKYKVNAAYADYIRSAGYDPMLICPENSRKNFLPVVADLCDGLVLPGGKDVDPIYYGHSNWGSFWCDADKDEFERKLLWAFMDRGKPVFGICRGLQLIACEYIYYNNQEVVNTKSGELVSERLEFEQHIDSHSQTDHFNLLRRRASHYVIGREDVLYGDGNKEPRQIPVNSMHHQCLKVNRTEDQLWKRTKVAPHMWLTAWTTRGLEGEEDCVVGEGFVIKGWTNSRIAAVQWHPEELMDLQLLQNFFGSNKGKEIEANAS